MQEFIHPYINFILTGLIIFVGGIFQNIINRVLKKIAIRFNFDTNRRKVTSKIISLAIFLLVAIVLFGLWGVDKDKLTIYITSILTILGVAFFAQWSHLSNISAGVILYFNHPIRIGDTVTLKAESPQIVGRITDIGLFFSTIKTPDDERIMVPNSMFLQSIVSVSDGPQAVKSEEEAESAVLEEKLS